MKASIRNRLLFLLCTSSLLIWLIIGGVSWWHTGLEVREMLDEQLVRTARMLAIITLHESEERDLAEFESDLRRHGYDDTRVFQVWSDAAHELRTPLAGALTQAHVATHAESDQERDHALKQLMRSLNVLRRLVDQLLL